MITLPNPRPDWPTTIKQAVGELLLRLKIPIDEVAVIDLEAPVLSAYERRIDGAVRW